MKRTLSLILAFGLLSGLFGGRAFAETQDSSYGADSIVKFYQNGQEIQEKQTGPVSARIWVTSGTDLETLATLAVTRDNGLLDAAHKKVTLSAGVQTEIELGPVQLTDTDAAVSVYLWDGELTPLAAAGVLPDSYTPAPRLTSVKAVVAGQEITGQINERDQTVAFDIPYTSAQNEINAYSGQTPPGVYPMTTETPVTAEGTGTVTDKTGTTAETSFVLNLDEDQTLTVTGTGGAKTVYTLKPEYTAVSRRYNFNGAKIAKNLTDAKDVPTRVGAPMYLGGGSAAAGNFGDGVWHVSGIAYQDGAPDPANSFGSLTIENDMARLVKDKTGGPVSLNSQTDYYNGTRKLTGSLDFCLTEMETAGGLFTVTSSDLDQLVFYCDDPASGTYRLGHRAGEGAPLFALPDAPALKTGEWHNLTYVFRKGGDYPQKYTMEIYLDQTYAGEFAGKDKPPVGWLNRSYVGGADGPKNGEAFCVTALADAKLGLLLDNMSTTAIDDYAHRTQVHLLGDSICRYYPAANAPQQGWGKYFDDCFDSTVQVINHSVGGYNTNIYLNGADRDNLKSAPIWRTVKQKLEPGDYVMIALGWNEDNPTDGTMNEDNLKANLEILASDCTALGVTPIFVTPTTNLNSIGTDPDITYALGNTRFNKARFIRGFAGEHGYLCLDLNERMYHTLSQLPLDQLMEFYTGTCAAESNKSPSKDTTHITEDAAAMVSGLLRDLLAESSCPLKDRLKSSPVSIRGVTAQIGDAVYPGQINTLRNTITIPVAYPYSGTPPTREELAAAVITFDTEDTVLPAVPGTVQDLNGPAAYTITSRDGTDTQRFTLQCEASKYLRTYDVQGATLLPTTHATVRRRGALGYLSSDKGKGMWYNEGTAFDEKGLVNEAGTYGSFSVETEDGNQFVRMEKTKTGGALNMASLAGDDVIKDASSNQSFSISFRFRLNSYPEGYNDGIFYISSGSLDQLMISTRDAADGRYYMGYRANWDDNSWVLFTNEPLRLGEWHTMNYVFRKYPDTKSGYNMEFYLDGRFLTESDCAFKTNRADPDFTKPAGNLWGSSTYVTPGNQLYIRSFSGSLFSADFDDFVFTYLSDCAE